MGCLLLPEAPSLEQLLQKAPGTPRTVRTSGLQQGELGTAASVPSRPGLGMPTRPWGVLPAAWCSPKRGGEVRRGEVGATWEAQA